jgi:Na+-transporting NADH:ubiquinone oxidoreductase subunit C
MSDGSNKKSYLKTILFAFVLCMVCGSLLTLASTGFKSHQLKNVAMDKQKNILRAVNLITAEESPSPGEVEKRYGDNIRRVWIDESGNFSDKTRKHTNDLIVYIYGDLDNPKAYIIPVHSRGLWGKILGYIALDNDGTTISGFTVYSHSETPGLGGEIEKNWFQENFKGKKITDQNGEFISVGIAKGRVVETIARENQENYVDGISGATLTGKFLSAGLKQVLMEYEHFSEKFRNVEQDPSTKSN